MLISQTVATPPVVPATTGRPIVAGLLIAAVLILPGLASFLGASSLATGTAAAAAAIIIADLAGLLGPAPGNRTGLVAVVGPLAIFLPLHLFVGTSLAEQGDWGRAALSFVILMTMLIAAWILASRIPALTDHAVDRIMLGLLALFAFAALLSIAGLQPPSPRGILAKSVFPFSEPSHYAFSAAPLIFFACIRLTFVPRTLVILVFLAIAYLLQSLSLVIVMIVSALVTLPIVWLALGVVVAVPALAMLDTQYFVDRLDFSAHSTNISSLIYIQGVELAESGLATTSGWGIGFQQLGIGEIRSLTANAVMAILREDANIFDGGFTGAKLVAEFGVFGLAFILVYAVLATATIVRLRRSGDVLPVTSAEILFSAALLGFLIEMFVRGAGYFTGTGLLLIASLFHFAQTRRTAASPTGRRY